MASIPESEVVAGQCVLVGPGVVRSRFDGVTENALAAFPRAISQLITGEKAVSPFFDTNGIFFDIDESL